MGQTYKDYVQAGTDAAHKALEAMHQQEERMITRGSDLLDQFSLRSFGFVLTDENADEKQIPSVQSTDSVKMATAVATSGDITAQTTVRKLAEARLVKGDNGKLPFPFNTYTIIPLAVTELLLELNAFKLTTGQVQTLLLNTDPQEWEDSLGPLFPVLDDHHRAVIKSGKVKSLTFDGFLTKRLNKTFKRVMGSGVLLYDSWNESYAENKWVLHVHDDGQVVAEKVEVTNHVKRILI